jgi:hypothetical protein
MSAREAAFSHTERFVVTTESKQTPTTRKPLPTAAQVLEHLTYDPETGHFHRTKNGPGVRAGQLAGTSNPDGRREISVFNRKIKAARLAWLVTTGEWPKGEVDHINGDPSDNRIVNLRDVSRMVNQQNQRRAKSSNRSGLLGVKQVAKWRWDAYITLEGKKLFLGRFYSPDEAHSAYLTAKRQLHEGCTI